MLANIVLNSILTKYLAHVGIALATSIVSILHAIVLLVFLDKKCMHIHFSNKISRFTKSLVMAGILLALFLNFYPAEVSEWITWSINYKIFKLSEIFALAGIIYCGTLWMTGFKLKNVLVGGY